MINFEDFVKEEVCLKHATGNSCKYCFGNDKNKDCTFPEHKQNVVIRKFYIHKAE